MHLIVSSYLKGQVLLIFLVAGLLPFSASLPDLSACKSGGSMILEHQVLACLQLSGAQWTVYLLWKKYLRCTRIKGFSLLSEERQCSLQL